MPSNASTVLPGGIILVDEPESVGVATLAGSGEVLMTMNLRPGGEVNQIIVGLTPNMLMQLLMKLQTHSDVCARAIAEGKGGALFKEKESN